MLRRFHEAKISGLSHVQVWGSGNQKREFMYIDDFADAVVYLMNHYNRNEPINVGTSEDISAKQLARVVKKVVGYEGKIVFDRTKLDGALKRVLDVSKVEVLCWKYRFILQIGLKITYEVFLKQLKSL